MSNEKTFFLQLADEDCIKANTATVAIHTVSSYELPHLTYLHYSNYLNLFCAGIFDPSLGVTTFV